MSSKDPSPNARLAMNNDMVKPIPHSQLPKNLPPVHLGGRRCPAFCSQPCKAADTQRLANKESNQNADRYWMSDRGPRISEYLHAGVGEREQRHDEEAYVAPTNCCLALRRSQSRSKPMKRPLESPLRDSLRGSSREVLPAVQFQFVSFPPRGFNGEK